jgi:uncharacterized protein YgbK (DUF1537 family)
MQQGQLLMVFYGDDFTGSTDAMEVLEGQGVSTVLFIQPPTEARLNDFAHARCIGIAGTARTMDQAAMERHLAPLFRQLMEMNAPVMQYKMCSTADSTSETGSIGKVVELGKRLLQQLHSCNGTPYSAIILHPFKAKFIVSTGIHRCPDIPLLR